MKRYKKVFSFKLINLVMASTNLFESHKHTHNVLSLTGPAGEKASP